MADDKPIIIIKKKGGHGGHHGGAWKVALADFMTAMMAFFMVMWLVNSASVATRQNIATYFRQPGLFDEGSGTPLMIGEAGILPDGGFQARTRVQAARRAPDLKPPEVQGEEEVLEDPGDVLPEDQGPALKIEDLPDDLTTETDAGEATTQEEIRALAERVRFAMMASPELEGILGDIDVQIDGDGVNIEIKDTEQNSMFHSGSAAIKPSAKEAFIEIAEVLKSLPNKISIVGHTDGQPYSTKAGEYSNWELSADRANSARRMLEQSGFEPSKITNVIGRADKDLKVPDDPLNPHNRRITLRIQFEPPTLEPVVEETPVSDEAEAAVATPAPPRLTTREIISGVRNKEVIQLPDATPTPDPEQAAKKKGLFEESPVIRPFSIFEDLL